MRLAPALLAGALALAGCGKSNEPAEDALGTPGADAPAPAVEPTAAMGEQIFKRCMACHTIAKDGANGIGPNLYGVVGAPVAAKPGYAYSAAMTAKGGHWDAATLDVYLKRPTMAVPGTKMAFAGVPDDADRRALILYLEQKSK